MHEGRKLYHLKETPQIPAERILCLGSSRKRPVLKWENNIAWPGRLTLTDKALYYEVWFVSLNHFTCLSMHQIATILIIFDNYKFL